MHVEFITIIDLGILLEALVNPWKVVIEIALSHLIGFSNISFENSLGNTNELNSCATLIVVSY